MRRLYVDTHCHLDQYPDPEAVLTEATRRRVVVVAVTETPADFQRQRARFGEQDFLRAALGLHPLRAARLSGREVERFFSSLGQTDYVGEIGIDLSRHGKPTGRRQIELFERVLGDERIKTKVLTIHSRAAARETVERLAQAEISGVLHWYTGSTTVADQALSAGLYFSVNSAMLQSQRGRKLVASLPHERVLTETDGPYCRSGSRPSVPSDVPSVVRSLAKVWSVTEDVAATTVVDNLARLYRQAVQSTSSSADQLAPVSAHLGESASRGLL